MAKITIIVCTQNRAELLQECLESIAHQTIDRSNYEVMVVDNNSTDNTQQIAGNFSNKYENFNVCFEENIGLCFARNTGYKATKTEWIAYIDDDAKAEHNYVERVLDTIKKYDFDYFGGVYLAWYKYGKPHWFTNKFFTNQIENATEVIENFDGFVSGGNMAMRTSVLNEVGGFSTRTWMRGGKIRYGEETLLQVELKRLGKTIGFDPKLIIHHIVRSNKLCLQYFIKHNYHDGLDHWKTFDEKPSCKNVSQIFYYGTKLFIKTFLSGLPKLLRPNYYIQNWIVESFAPYCRVWGQVINAVFRI